MAATAKALAKNLERMRTIAMALPEATEEVTWGTDINFRVRKKIFAFPGHGDSLTVKADRDELPALLDDPRFTPAPYLARGGWVRDGPDDGDDRLERDRRADPHVVLPDRAEEAWRRSATR